MSRASSRLFTVVVWIWNVCLRLVCWGLAASWWAFGKWLDPNSNLVHGFILGRSHNKTVLVGESRSDGKWGLAERKSPLFLRSCMWLWLFLLSLVPACFLPWGQHPLPRVPITIIPGINRSVDRGPKPLSPTPYIYVKVVCFGGEGERERTNLAYMLATEINF